MSAIPKMIVLRSSDGETFEVEEAVALESQTIKHMIEDDCADTSIPLPNVIRKILAKVIEYCKKHFETPKNDEKSAEDELKAFDTEFVKVDQGTLFDLILISNKYEQKKRSAPTTPLNGVQGTFAPASEERQKQQLQSIRMYKIKMGPAVRYLICLFVILTSFTATAMAKGTVSENIQECYFHEFKRSMWCPGHK